MADAAEEAAPPPPPGFVLMDRRGGFSTHNGPYLYDPAAPDGSRQAFFALRRHCNGYGIVHGGMLAGFIDGLLGHAVGRAAGRPAVTIHLSLDYLSMARAGEWVLGESRVNRLSKEVAFAEARAFVGDRDVIRATAVFKLMEPRPGRAG